MDFSKGKKIHEGKFSVVYILEHKGSKYIIKQLHPRLIHNPTSILQFKNEALVPYFEEVNVKTLDYKESGADHFIIREYVEGVTLKQLHTDYKRKKYHLQYRGIYLQLCDKLSKLHEQGIIHGDIKPSNILFTGGDFKTGVVEIRLLDLGLAVNKKNLPIKTSEPVHFSMLYSAPELMLNEPQYISELTDLFSVGVCMYETFSGDVPYHENHPAILLQMMLSVPLTKTWKISKEFFALISALTPKPAFKKPIAHYTIDEVQNMLQKNLTERSAIQNADELKTKLASIS